MSGRFRRVLPLGHGSVTAGAGGAKAARLSAALRAGFPVLPGWVVPSAESRPAVRAGAAMLRGGHPAAGRRAAGSCPPDPALAAELREAAARLGGQVIVRSSSPLEDDQRWSGAFSSVAGVGPDDAATAVRSCWAAAFAVDPLARLGSCGLPLEALELGLLIQPEIRPAAGGVARVLPPARTGGTARPGGTEVLVDGVEGHPGALLSGWADGASARVLLPAAAAAPLVAGGSPGRAAGGAEGALTDLVGRDLVGQVARLAEGIYRTLGDDMIEWAACDGTAWLLQSLRAAPSAALGRERDPGPRPGAAQAFLAPIAPDDRLAAREWMPLLAVTVEARGQHLRGRPAVAGKAAGRLVTCRPHQRPPAEGRDAILLVEHPLPALAPLLFAARGVIAHTGAAGSHLAGVARSLAVPMVTGCHLETVTGSRPLDAPWLAAIDGTTGEVALLPG